jgi:hypothetical protein
MDMVEGLDLSASTLQARIYLCADFVDVRTGFFGVCADLILMLVEEIFQFDRFGGGSYDNVRQILGVA